MYDSGDRQDMEPDVRGWSALPWTWRPDRTTAAVLIGTLFLYLTIVSLRTIPTLVGEVSGSCGPAGAALACRVPGWAFQLAVIGLATPVAYALVVIGSAIELGGVARAHLLMELGLFAVAALEVAAVVSLLGSNQPGLGINDVWTQLVTALAALALAGFVSLLTNRHSARSST